MKFAYWWVRWHTPAILAPGILQQEDLDEFVVSLDYVQGQLFQKRKWKFAYDPDAFNKICFLQLILITFQQLATREEFERAGESSSLPF